MYSVQSIVYSVQCTEYSVQCTVSLQLWPSIYWRACPITIKESYIMVWCYKIKICNYFWIPLDLTYSPPLSWKICLPIPPDRSNAVNKNSKYNLHPHPSSSPPTSLSFVTPTSPSFSPPYTPSPLFPCHPPPREKVLNIQSFNKSNPVVVCRILYTSKTVHI